MLGGDVEYVLDDCPLTAIKVKIMMCVGWAITNFVSVVSYVINMEL